MQRVLLAQSGNKPPSVSKAVLLCTKEGVKQAEQTYNDMIGQIENQNNSIRQSPSRLLATAPGCKMVALNTAVFNSPFYCPAAHRFALRASTHRGAL